MQGNTVQATKGQCSLKSNEDAGPPSTYPTFRFMYVPPLFVTVLANRCLHVIIVISGAKTIPTSMNTLRFARGAADEDFDVELGVVEGEVEVGAVEDVVEESVAMLDEEVVEDIIDDVDDVDDIAADAMDDIVGDAEEAIIEELVF